jgi:hypothetical protein
LAPVNPQKGKSVLLLSTPSEDASDQDKQEAEEVEEDLLMIATPMIELLTKSPMVTTSRTWSPSPRPTTSKLWGHSPKSLMEIGPRLRPSLPSSSDTLYSTKESQDSSPLFDKSH